MWIDRKALIGRSIWRNDKYIYIRFDGLLILETNLHKSKIRWPVVPPGRRSLPAKTPSNFWLLFWWLRAELDWMNTYIGENTKDKYETSRNRFNRVYVTLVSTLFHSSNSNSLSCLKFLKKQRVCFSLQNRFKSKSIIVRSNRPLSLELPHRAQPPAENRPWRGGVATPVANRRLIPN